MQSIQELDRSSMGSATTSLALGSGPDIDPQLQRILGELENAAEARDQMAQRCHELDMQVCTRALSFGWFRIQTSCRLTSVVLSIIQ